MSGKGRTKPRLPANALAALGQSAGFLRAADRAEVLEISMSHLLHIERGAVRPSAAVLDRMAAAYGRPVAVIERASDETQIRLAERVIAQVKGFAS